MIEMQGSLRAYLELHLGDLKVFLTFIKLVWRKKYSFNKKIKSTFKSSKNLKINLDPRPLSLTAIWRANCSQSWSIHLVSVLKITWSKDKTRRWKCWSTYWSWTSRSRNKDLLDCQIIDLLYEVWVDYLAHWRGSTWDNFKLSLKVQNKRKPKSLMLIQWE